MKKRSFKFEEVATYVKDLFLKYWKFKGKNIGIWIFKWLTVMAIIVGIAWFLHNVGPYILLFAILILIFRGDQLKSALLVMSNVYNNETDIALQNRICSTALFRTLNSETNATIFNIISPKMISDIIPDITKYTNPQKIGDISFLRYPIKLYDENKKMNYELLTDTLNVMIAKKCQNGEIENISSPFYRDISAIQVLSVSPDICTPSFLAFDIMYVDTLAKYNYILQRHQIKQEKGDYCPPPVDEDF